MARNAGRPRRVTIADIAERAGVSKGAVSYALNGQPGVSDATRERIRAITAELGYRYPNRAARSLSASRADACGLVISDRRGSSRSSRSSWSSSPVWTASSRRAGSRS